MLTFQRCGPEHLAALRELSIQTFHDTFSHLNSEENMRAYIETAYAGEALAAELANPASAFYFAFDGKRIAGYIKVNDAPAQTELNDPDTLELERIYLRREHQGKGDGRLLLEKAISIAMERGRTRLWLGVWEKNEKALAFYRRNGFEVFGEHAFVMGDDAQTDLLMRKNL